ncbi:Holliday junction branch migration protein RuvA [Candidatus Kuenenbacteria bacterium CG11_big_fil_rev_8_21_14_0_20_37_9]|uniref:Holliday junction branch migration complex subunit RuvA n=1 Tax=Candidatus Kuenenbacteria bacterium CG08_land_8_20_14_0_20_37_23 TaxID=1974617 RepID=A0A2M6XTF6_9BACT|nr:MAG: Holliday junction branch migration protein RuvA [Candidatus Kuenenbacteria bacterium CG11_big_fil_rev_8_21_14_0_20_37_9]PIU10925.1 MAG: Holliday junction branch migration protein RuvA [Candidatus Kuenenbacteria bacterium CG08_land_8_20_14_0_20_37_23]
MISYLKGKILAKNQKSVIAVVHDIGYEIFVTENFLEKIKVNDEIELHTYLKHDEDNMALYGFRDKEELLFFKLLITISGVGPKTALGVLEVAKLADIKKAILRDEPSILYKVSGVGKKTAERIVVELKNKIDALPMTEKEISFGDVNSEVFDALVSLGYAQTDVREALKQMPETVEKMEEKIKKALKILGKK